MWHVATRQTGFYLRSTTFFLTRWARGAPSLGAPGG
jgi:hypothetical protein